jgi:hypothetical protein
MEDDMRVIAHHRIRIHRNREESGQKPDPILDSLSSMIEVFPGEHVDAIEKGSTDTAGDNMKESRLIRRRNLAAWICHACSVACGTTRGNKKKSPTSCRISTRFLGRFLGCPGCVLAFLIT